MIAAPVRINITLDRESAERLERLAAAYEDNRSATIRAALRLLERQFAADGDDSDD